jgi:hypothetical protein
MFDMPLFQTIQSSVEFVNVEHAMNRFGLRASALEPLPRQLLAHEAEPAFRGSIGRQVPGGLNELLLCPSEITTNPRERARSDGVRQEAATAGGAEEITGKV